MILELVKRDPAWRAALIVSALSAIVAAVFFPGSTIGVIWSLQIGMLLGLIRPHVRATLFEIADYFKNRAAISGVPQDIERDFGKVENMGTVDRRGCDHHGDPAVQNSGFGPKTRAKRAQDGIDVAPRGDQPNAVAQS